MNIDFQAFTDAFADTQARTLAQSAMLDALIMSHPDRAALSEAWRRLSASRVAGASLQIAGGDTRAAQRYLVDAYAHWTRRLAELPAQGTPQG